jgi:hypothetical protein
MPLAAGFLAKAIRFVSALLSSLYDLSKLTKEAISPFSRPIHGVKRK